MKRFFVIVVMFLMSCVVMAQVPQRVSYQGMVVHSNNRPAGNETIGLRLSLLQGAMDGNVVYSETHRTTTNPNGLYSVVLGDGTTNDDFASIDWGNGPYYLKSDIDSAGGSIYLVHATNQLISVPYALYSATSAYALIAVSAEQADHAATADVVTKLNDSIRVMKRQMDRRINQINNHYDSALRYLRELIGVPMPKPVEPEPEEPEIEIVFIDSLHPGAIQNGIYSVSPTRKVRGSHGNLQYHADSNIWRFAPHQYDAIGMDNYNVAPDYNGWIDLFGWGTSGWNSGATSYLPYATTTGVEDYYPGGNKRNDLAGDYVEADWGKHNAIVGGGEQPGLWRTLSVDEWYYLFFVRDVPYRFAKARVADHNGLIIFPDNYTHPSDVRSPAGCNNVSISYTANTYTATVWSQLEENGCMFLPAAGFRRGSMIYNYNTYGEYWTSTHGDNLYSFYSSTTSSSYGTLEFTSEATAGCSVRLFQDEYLDSAYDAIYNQHPSTYSTVSGELPAEFSVASGRKVIFAKGNLQYQASTRIWRFAEHQYTYIGDQAGNTTEALMRENQSDWIDLFGWGTSGWRDGIEAYMPFSTTTQNSSYIIAGKGNIDLAAEGSEADWGVHNPISNGGNTAGMWRTLTYSEWTYLLNTRKVYYNGSETTNRYAKAKVARVNGIIIIPDHYNHPVDVRGIYRFNYSGDNYTYNIYTPDEWAKMEMAGCVFLPAAGVREGVIVSGEGLHGRYWTADNYIATKAYSYKFDRNSFSILNDNRYIGASVRLVHNVEGSTIDTMPTEPVDKTPLAEMEPEGATIGQFSISDTKIVRFSQGNLQYQASTNTWRFAEHQYDFIGAHEGNTAIALNRATNTEWIDLFGWGTSGWNSGSYIYQPYFISMGSSYYYPGGDKHNSLIGNYAHADWGVHNAISNGGNSPRRWRTLSYYEWDYLLFRRATSTVGTTSNARFVYATVAGNLGIILLPDSYTHPDSITAFRYINRVATEGSTANYNQYNVYDQRAWEALESAGCVFLPYSGYQSGSATVNGANDNGYYWSTTHLDISNAYAVFISKSRVVSGQGLTRGAGAAVRLVWDQTD